MLQLGRQGQLYGIQEVTYGVTPALTAAHAVRHRNFVAKFDNQNRRSTNEKRQSPFVNATQRSDTRVTADYSYEGIIRPSGVINTLPEVDFMLKAAFGARTNVTLATTVTSGGAVGGATLASAGTLAVKDFVLITCPDGKKRLRQLQSVAGAVVTWAPNLPAGQQPTNGASVKGCITYKTITQGNPSLSFAHYLKKTDGSAGVKRAVNGAAPHALALMLDANDDVKMRLSGPARQVVDAPAQPGGFTMVGGQPSSILQGDLFVNNTELKFLSASFEFTNGLWLRNDEYASSMATEMIRRDEPTFSVKLNMRAEDEAPLYDASEAGTNVSVFSQTDYTEGKTQAVFVPVVEFKPPSADDPMEEVKWDFTGQGLESADGALDAIYFAIG